MAAKHDEIQPSLFTELDSTAYKSPSEQFRAAHPDAKTLNHVTTDWDPNARRAEQTRDVGGGIAAAISGKLYSDFDTSNDSGSDKPVPMPDSIRKIIEDRKKKPPFSINDISEDGFFTADRSATKYLDSKLRQVGKHGVR